jgi:uncharacterized protein (TIGR03067 family)
MKHLIALLLALAVLLGFSVATAARFADEKDKDAKKDEKKDEKKDLSRADEAKKDDKKDKGKDGEKPTPAQEAALKTLSGTWLVISYEREGKKEPDARIKKMKVVQDGTTWKFFDGEDITLGKDTVSPDKTPKEVDSLYENGPQRTKTAKGIYKLDGDTLTYCHADPGMPRPTDFSSGKEKSGLTLMVLKKQKEESPLDGKKDEKKDDKKDDKKDAKKDEKKDEKKDAKKDEKKDEKKDDK